MQQALCRCLMLMLERKTHPEAQRGEHTMHAHARLLAVGQALQHGFDSCSVLHSGRAGCSKPFQASRTSGRCSKLLDWGQ